MDYVKKVNNLSLHGNLSENWKRFKQNYDIFEEAAGINNQTQSVRVASFLNTIGEDALELFNNFDMSDEDRKCYAAIQNAFEKYCSKNRVVLKRFEFFSRRQMENEPLMSYLADLAKMATSCEFKEQEMSLIRDQFLSGVMDKSLQHDLLLLEDDLNYEKILELLVLLKMAQIQKTNQLDEYVTEGSLQNQLSKMKDEKNVGMTKELLKKEKPKAESPREHPCHQCNQKHRYRHCPAFGKKCLKCFELHHFAVCCQYETEDFKKPCSKCNLKHKYRDCPAFGKRCVQCHQFNHFAVNCRRYSAGDLSLVKS